MQPTAADIDSFAIIPFLSQQQTLSGLKEELPAYLATCLWWKMNSESLPKWSTGAKQILLIQPSSAAAERVFSLLTTTFSEQHIHSSNDYVEASIMLQYNHSTSLLVTLLHVFTTCYLRLGPREESYKSILPHGVSAAHS